MDMEWYQVVGTVLGGIATFLGGGWIMNFYNAKPKKNSIEIDNLKKVIDELQDVINQMSQSSKEYREETNRTINELKKEVSDLSIRVDIKHEAIYASSRCEHIDDTKDCIVMQTFKKRCEECNIR